MIVISDTSPIKALFQIKKLSLLKDLFGKIVIPQSVNNELQKDKISLPNYFLIKSVINQDILNSFLGRLDEGEAEAITIAKEINADLIIIDEKIGRKIAQKEGLKVIGLLGIFILAKNKGLVPSVKELLEELKIKDNFYLSENLEKRIIEQAGE